MARPKSISECKRGRDVRKLSQSLANKSDDIEYGNGGNHPYVKVKGKGKMPIPFGVYGKGLLSAIRKQWWALGLPIAFLMYHIIN